MLEYFVLYILIFFAIFVFALSVREQKCVKYICIVSFGLILVLLALRHQYMGIDLGYGRIGGYLSSYDFFHSTSWKQIITMNSYMNYEIGFIVFSKLVAFLSRGSRQIYIAICAIVSVFPIAYIVYKKSKSVILSVFIYLGLPTFLFLYSGLRQSIAIGICFFSIKYIQEKKLIKFLVLILIAMLFHYSAIIFFLAYFIYHWNCNDFLRWMSVIVLPIIFLLRYPIFNAFSRIFKASAVADSNGSIKLFLILVFIYIICILLSCKNKEQNGYMNLFYMACVCQLFGNIYNIAGRVGYYFLLFLVLLLPEICFYLKSKRENYLLQIVIAGCFIVFALYSIQTTSWARAYPYYWFWQYIPY